VPEVVTSGLSVPTSASPRALLASTSRRVTLSGSLNLPPKAMCTAPSARDAPALRLSRSSIEPLRGVAPGASSRAAEMSERARPVTVWPDPTNSETMAGPVWPDPPVTNTCLQVRGGGPSELVAARELVKAARDGGVRVDRALQCVLPPPGGRAPPARLPDLPKSERVLSPT